MWTIFKREWKKDKIEKKKNKIVRKQIWVKINTWLMLELSHDILIYII